MMKGEAVLTSSEVATTPRTRTMGMLAAPKRGGRLRVANLAVGYANTASVFGLCMSAFKKAEIWVKARRLRLYRRWLRGSRAILVKSDLHRQRDSVQAVPSLREAVGRSRLPASRREQVRSRHKAQRRDARSRELTRGMSRTYLAQHQPLLYLATWSTYESQPMHLIVPLGRERCVKSD